jgi:hypothetical protein
MAKKYLLSLSLNFDFTTKVGLTAAEENDKVIEQNKDL